MRTSRWRYLAIAFLFALVAAGCGSDKKDDDAGTSGSTTAPSGAKQGSTIRLVPQQFGESETLTEVYAQYLEAKGFKVDVQKSSGFRPIVYPALDDGKADLLIDYTGSAAKFLDPKAAPPADAEGTYDLLKTKLEGKDYEALDYSPAEDKNAFVVTKAFAADNDLKTVSDVKAVEDKVTFGASSDCAERTDCLKGYEDPAKYGLKFKGTETIEYGPPLVEGLKSDTVQAVQYQTTGPEIDSGDFVVLEDDKGIFGGDNIVPIIRTALVTEYGDTLTDAINELSAKLTTEDLIKWNVSTDLDKEEPADVAKAWLEDKGLI